MVPEDLLNNFQLLKNIKWKLRVYPRIILQAIVLDVADVLGCCTLSLGDPMSIKVVNASPDLY